MYWRSAMLPSDQFVVYCFDAPHEQVDLVSVMAGLRERSCGINDLRLRILPVPGDLDRPYWVRADVDHAAFAVHRPATWGECLTMIAELIDDQLDPAESAWRGHLFGPIADAPCGDGGGDGPAVVAVVQVSHALADGRGTAAICRALFGTGGREVTDPAGDVAGWTGAVRWIRTMRWMLAAAGVVRLPVSVGSMIWFGMRSFIEYRRAATEQIATPTRAPQPAGVLNRHPGSRRSLRVIVLPRPSLSADHSVTVVALTAISFALDELLGPAPRRAIELTVGTPPRAGQRNNFRNAAIELHPESTGAGERMARIAEEVAVARRFVADPDPVAVAARRAESATPAFLAHWGVRQLEADTPPSTVTGVTVVSSVNRGPADLMLAGGAVRFTAGFPALSPAQGLTHGVHGIGLTVAISVTASPEIVDVESYIARRRRGLDRVSGDGEGRAAR